VSRAISGWLGWVAVLSLWALPVSAELLPFEIDSEVPRTWIVDHVEYLEDPTATRTLDEVRSREDALRFRPGKGMALEFGHSRSAYWLRFRLHNPADEPQMVVVEVGSPRLDEVTLFWPQPSGEVRAIELGELRPIGRKFASFFGTAHLDTIAPGETVEAYARVASTGALSIPVYVATPASHVRSMVARGLGYGLLYGFVAALLVYHLFLGLSTRESVYGWFAAHTGSVLVMWLLMDRVGAEIWAPWMQMVDAPVQLAGLAVWFASIQFARHFLVTRERDRTSDLVLRVVAGVVVLAMVVTLLLDATITARLTMPVFLSAPLLLVWIGVRALRHDAPVARLFLMAWSAYLLTVSYSVLAAMGALTSFGAWGRLETSHVAVKLGLAVELGLFSLALAQRINALKGDGVRLRSEARSEALGRLEAERALAERDAQLRQSQKMEAIGRLAGGIAHDFNNLLQAILGYAEILLMRLREGDPNRSELGEIRTAAERAASLTSQLLAFSRRQVLKTTDIDLNELVDAMSGLLRRLLGEDIDIRFTCAPEPAWVHGDRGQLEQVLMNLCVNARDAMPRGGVLEIRLARVERGANRLEGLDWVTEPSYIELTVRDTGMGIPADVLEHVFEPFYTTKAEGQGTGLGLSTVYGIVRQHRGMVRVRSTLGVGTTFWVYLPYAAPAQDPAAREGGRGA
jgi:signal transduction histidine kinase